MKKIIALFLCISMVISFVPTFTFAQEKENMTTKDGYTYFMLTPDNITEVGGWQKATDTQGSYRKEIMYAYAADTVPAKLNFKVPKAGSYYIFARTRDYAEQSPGTRTFSLSVDGKDVSVYGTHKQEGFYWEKALSPRISAGEHSMEFTEISGRARFDLIFVTDDPDFFPTNDPEKLLEMESTFAFDASKIEIVNVDRTVGRPDMDIAVAFNDEWMEFDVPPVIMNGRTMVPFRAIFEKLGCTVSWKAESRTAQGIRNGVKIELPIGESYAMVNGQGKSLDQPAEIVDGRTLVPLRFVSEALSADVEWDGDSRTVFIYSVNPKETVLLTCDSFTDLGTWSIFGIEGTLTTSGLYGTTPGGVGSTEEDADASNTKPAVAPFSLTKAGKYNVWIRARDYATNKPGSRFFQIGFNGEPMFEQKFGTHGKEGFQWVLAGTYDFNAGSNNFYLYDTSGFYARFDAAVITEDLEYVPQESLAGMQKVAHPYVKDALEATKKYPAYAREQAAPTESFAIENEQTKVIFYKVPTSNGQVVQNEIYSKSNGEWIKTNSRTEQLGYLVMHANDADLTEDQNLLVSRADYTYNGESDTILTANPFKAGAGTWLIPSDYTVNGNQVTLTFPENELGTLTAVWSLDDNTMARVDATMNFKKEGYYSIGAFEGDEFDTDDVEYILAPFRYQYKRIPENPELLSEMYLFTPMGTYTLYENNKYANKPVTKGVVAEPSWIPVRWVKANDSLFGMTVKSQNNMCQGGIFAPIMGNEDSKMAQGDSYTLSYRVVSEVNDWFSAYENVTANLFDVTDYRKNYTASLNQAIFTTRDLMVDDVHGGWDPIDKAHFNIEGMNVTSTGNSMQALQDYLLTEDDELLEKRAIPTLANLLTRKAIHFNRLGIVGGGTYWAPKTGPDPIGSPIAGFNANVMGGIYEMTHGTLPYLLGYTQEKAQGEVTNSYGSIASFANDLSMYKYSGDKKYLDSAIEKADKYLEEVVYIEDTNIPRWDLFIYISYYPNLASLIDIYEVTNDKKYLDAAEYVAQWMSTGLWVPGVDGTRKTDPLVVNDINKLAGVNKTDYYNPQSNWQGSVNYRVGGNTVEEGRASDQIVANLYKEVEGWIPSRVGMGIEQASTFKGGKHIIMQSFAGDFMKLAGYTGNDYYATIARNSMLGRFSTYAGYYRSNFITYDQETDYPRFGPDYTGIYWHHIPPFLAMLEEFLINQAFAWSNANIHFPSLRQQGYAYFNSNQYGHEPGKFYDENDMWLWIDEGIVNPDSVQVDWVAAKKDGVLGIALMNEEHAPLTTTITLGDKVDKNYTGQGVLYDENGKVGTVDVVNGAFTVTLPKQGLMAVKLNIPTIKKPSYADIAYSLTEAEIGATMSVHLSGKAYSLQLSGDKYFAYVYTTDMAADIKSLSMTYNIDGGKAVTVTTDQYPFEFIIKVDDVNKTFNYELTATLHDGSTETRGKGVLKSKLNPEYLEGATNGEIDMSFEPITYEIKTRGRNGNNWRYVIPIDLFPFEDIPKDFLKGIKVRTVYTKKDDPTDVRILESEIISNDIRSDGKSIVLVIPSTPEVPTVLPDGSLFVDSDYTQVATFSPAE